MTDVHESWPMPQSFLLPPTQTPLSQKSLLVQNFPSSQAVPLSAGTSVHVSLGPGNCPVLHTETMHFAALSFEQSTPHGSLSPASWPASWPAS